jgi:hypothetical protein
MTPDEKGTIAETAVIHAAAKLHVPVLKPVNDGLRYDLAFDVGHRIFRVQCKWASRRGGCVIVSSRTCRRGPDGFIRSTYSSDDVDVIAAYCAEVDSCFAIPIDRLAGRPSIALRLAPARNNQQKGVNWARDFAFAATITRLVGP